MTPPNEAKTPEVTPAGRPAMGGRISEEGATFRVWAPHADAVYVAGDFNDWSRTAHPLAREGDGCWSAEVPGMEAGAEYKFLIVNGDQALWRYDPYARAMTSSVGNSILYVPDPDWEEQPFDMPAWNELVIYEMHVGTFHDQPGGPPGDFEDVIQKLPHLEELGVNAIQILPAAEFPGGFSWGYNPSNIFAVENDYGGPDAFKDLIRAAHARGLAVIFDVVYNHLGPSDLDLWQFDGWGPDDMGGIYFYNDERAQTPWGHTRPDYGRGRVRQYIRDNALMWLQEYCLDGLRWDATHYIRNVHGGDDPASDLPDGWSLMQWINQEIQDMQPWKISIAEDRGDNEWLTKGQGAGGAGFDAQWDTRFARAVRPVLIHPEDEARDVGQIRDALYGGYNGDPLQRVIYTESHDEVANGQARLPEEISPGDAGNWFAKKRSILGAGLVFTAPGIPLIFQAQEILEDRWFQDEDPIDWSKKKRYAGVFQLYRDLIRLRRNREGNTAGLCGSHVNVYHVNHQDKLIAYHRWDQGGSGDDVVVVMNLANRGYESYHLGFPRWGRWRVRLNSDWQGYDPEFGNHPSYDPQAEPGDEHGLPCHGEVGIGPYSLLILSQDV